jgi:hypothetical protein
MKTKVTALSVASLFWFSGCGGGGSDDPAPADQVVAAPAPTPPAETPPAATPAPTPAPSPVPISPAPTPPAPANDIPIVPAGFISGDRAPVAISPVYPEDLPPPTTELHLFSSESTPVYLGCLTCGPQNVLDICYAGGRYGSGSGEASVWNTQTPYGNPTSPYAVWNAGSPTGPVVVSWDKTKGNDPTAFANLGQWTSNSSGPWKFGRGTTSYLDQVADAYLRNNDVGATRTSVCGPE